MTPSYEAVIARVGALATVLLHTLRVVTVMLVLGAVGLFVGIGVGDEWSRPGLVLGGVLAGATAVVAVIVLRFTLDVGKVRQLPNVTRADVEDAARLLSTSVVEGERQFVDASGLRKLLKLFTGLRTLKSDVDTLAEGGMAPAVALGRALVPSRALFVTLAAVASPFVLTLGLFVLVVGLTWG